MTSLKKERSQCACGQRAKPVRVRAVGQVGYSPVGKDKQVNLSPDGWKSEQDQHMLQVSEMQLPTVEPQRMPLLFVSQQEHAVVHK